MQSWAAVTANELVAAYVDRHGRKHWEAESRKSPTCDAGKGLLTQQAGGELMWGEAMDEPPHRNAPTCTCWRNPTKVGGLLGVSGKWGLTSLHFKRTLPLSGP